MHERARFPAVLAALCLSLPPAACATDEAQQGRVEFASKEGAAALYDSQASEPVAPHC